MAPLILGLHAIAAHQERELRVSVCITGQHREMLDQVLQLFQIKPTYDLDVMRPGQDLTDITTRVLHGMRDVIRELRPNLLLVHGDTTTTFAAALAAFYQRCQVGHVEAGLRTGDIYSPWPEELNRRLVTSIAQIHFAPTAGARNNLMSEGVSGDRILVTGNTVVDALQLIQKRIDGSEELRRQLEAQFSFLNGSKRLILVTGHRRENFGEGFERICLALRDLANREDIEIVYPVHLNPNVREPVFRVLGTTEHIHLIEPIDYLPFVYLMSRCSIILTDSGGIQEEAPSVGKPVLLMRSTTERPEGVQAGTVKLVGTSREQIVREVGILLDNPAEYRRMANSKNPYGDGHAASRITQWIASHN